jgi:P27 family predicted phage terminase small subunit
MGKRGPAPKPSALKLVQGTYRPDRAAANEPQPERVTPSCPTWLDAEAKREWRRIVPELETLGLLTRIDRAALAAYCQSYSEWWAMERAIREKGRTQTNAMSGVVSARPEVGMRDRALTQMKAFLTEFGLTPSSRSRVSVPETKKKPSNPFLDTGS